MENLPQKSSIVVIGAGLCGLSAVYHLEKAGFSDYICLEKNHEVGGLARTETYDGFSFDHSIHILYTTDPYATDLICNDLLKGNIYKQVRESYCYSSGVYTEYPYQANNYGLPVDIIVENILGLIDAHQKVPSMETPEHFESWIYQTFGAGIAKNFMIPYNQRVWAWDLKEMSYDWIANRVPMPDIKEVILGALKPPVKKYGPNREFWYPIQGGIEALSRGFLNHIPQNQIRLNCSVKWIDAQNHCVILSEGHRIQYDHLISTVPLPLLVQMLKGEVPEAVQESAKHLKNNVVHTVNIGLKGSELGIKQTMHWIYFPQDETIFHRISFPHHFSSWMAPEGCSSIQVEISESSYYLRNKPTLIQETLDGLVKIGCLTPRETLPCSQGGRVSVAKVITLNPAYIIYDLKHRENVNAIRAFLQPFNIETRGRFGDWEYFNMDHSILSGKKAIHRILEIYFRKTKP